MLPTGSERGNRPTYAQIEQALDIVVARAKRAGKIKTSEDGYRRAIRSRWGDNPEQVFEVLELKKKRNETGQTGSFPNYEFDYDGPQGEYEDRDDRVYLSLLDWMEARPELVSTLERLVDYERRHGPEPRMRLQQRIRDDMSRAPAADRLGDRFWTLQPIVDEERRRFLFGVKLLFEEDGDAL